MEAMRETKDILLDIFRLALQSEDVELRDRVVTYIASAELVEAVEVLKEHIPNEELGWLQSYTVKTYEFLAAKKNGHDSTPPGGADPEDTLVTNRQRYRKTMRNMGAPPKKS